MFRSVILGALALLAAQPASAALVTYNSRAAFTAAAPTAQTETFAQPGPASYDCKYGEGYDLPLFNVTTSATADDGVCIIAPSYGAQYKVGSSTGILYGNDTSGTTATFTFAGGGATAFGIDLGALEGYVASYVFHLPGGDVAIPSPVAGGAAFFGFVSDVAIASISITHAGIAMYDNASVVLAPAMVPEPSVALMLLTGLAGIAVAKRRAA